MICKLYYLKVILRGLNLGGINTKNFTIYGQISSVAFSQV
jgi:hypothetical protein